MSFKKFFNNKTIATLGALLAMNIILGRFLSISQWNMKIGFGFIPIVICAYFYGPVPAGIVAGLGDLIGAVLFPTGPYFPGFTLTAFISGVVFGIFLHKYSTYKLIIAVVINQIIGTLLLNTLWVAILYGSNFFVVLTTRLMQSLVMSAVQIFVTMLIEKVLLRKLKYVLS